MEFDIIVPCWGIDMDCARPALRGWLSGLNLGSWAKHRTPRRFCMRRLGQAPSRFREMVQVGEGKTCWVRTSRCSGEAI